MDNISTITSIIINLGFWAIFLYVIIRIIRKKKYKIKQLSDTEISRTETSAAGEVKWSTISKILRWRATSWREAILTFGISFILIIGGVAVIISNIDTEEMISGEISRTKTYYVKPKTANVRECPSTSCKVISTFSQNAELAVPKTIIDKYPDWIEVTFSDGKLGYVSKSVLSEDKSAISPVASSESIVTGNPSSVGGLIIGPWADIQATVGESYEFHFCEPPAAISGATCGGLVGATTNPRGGKPPYSFVKKSGFLPPGMTLELNGIFKGAPTQAGTYNFRLCAKDLYGGEGCQDLAVVVKKGIVSPLTDAGPASPRLPSPPTKKEPSAPVIESFECTRVGPFGGSMLEGEGGYCFAIKATGRVSGPTNTSFGFNSRSDLKLGSCSSWDWVGSGVFPPGGENSCYRSNESTPEETSWEIIAKNRGYGYTNVMCIEKSYLPFEIDLTVHSSLYFGGGEFKKITATAVCQ